MGLDTDNRSQPVKQPQPVQPQPAPRVAEAPGSGPKTPPSKPPAPTPGFSGLDYPCNQLPREEAKSLRPVVDKADLFADAITKRGVSGDLKNPMKAAEYINRQNELNDAVGEVMYPISNGPNNSFDYISPQRMFYAGKCFAYIARNRYGHDPSLKKETLDTLKQGINDTVIRAVSGFERFQMIKYRVVAEGVLKDRNINNTNDINKLSLKNKDREKVQDCINVQAHFILEAQANPSQEGALSFDYFVQDAIKTDTSPVLFNAIVFACAKDWPKNDFQDFLSTLKLAAEDKNNTKSATIQNKELQIWLKQQLTARDKEIQQKAKTK